VKLDEKIGIIDDLFESLVYEKDNLEVDHFRKGDRYIFIATFYNTGKKFIGIAKKHPQDVFNDMVGLELSMQRCKDKIKKYMAKNKIKYEQQKVDIYKEEIRKCENNIAFVKSVGIKL